MKLTTEKIMSLLAKARLSRDKKDVYGVCPWCGHDEFGISLSDNHVFNCFRKKNCGQSGNIYTLLTFLKHFEFLTKTHVPTHKLSKLIEEAEELDLEVKTIKHPLGFYRVTNNEYLEGRNFTSYEKFKVGKTRVLYSLKKYLIFQIIEDGELKGYVGRFEGDEGYGKMKYNNSETDFTKVVLGIDELNEETEKIIIVEGVFDKDNVDRELELDIQSTVKCVATFGAKLSEEQIIKIGLRTPNLKIVYIMHESDVLNSVKKNGLLANEFFPQVKVCHIIDKDPGEMLKKELLKCIEESLDPIKFNVSKVKKGILK